MNCRSAVFVVAALAVACSGGDSATTPDPVVVPTTPVLTTIEVSAVRSTTIFLGTTSQLVASAHDQRGNAISATVSWSSSNQTVATVNANGLVTSATVGTSTITATATLGAVTVSTNVPVVVSSDPPALSAVSIATAETTVEQGETLQLQATTKDQYGNPVTATVVWTTSSATVALVSATGLVSGVEPGTVTITATASVASATAAKSVVLTVAPPFPLSADVATSGNSFVPASVDIKRSGSVTWTFNATHNVVFDAAPGAPPAISDRASGAVSRQFNTPGTFGYTCTIHAGMSGTVVVH